MASTIPDDVVGQDRFRMIIEDRYHRMAMLRKYTKYTLSYATFAIALRAAWMCIPYLLPGKMPPDTHRYMIGIFMIALLAFYAGRQGHAKERIWALKVCVIMNGIMAGFVALTGYQYHVMSPKETLYPKILASWLEAEKDIPYGSSLGYLEAVEAIVDTQALLASVVACMTLHAYVMSKGMKDEQLKMDYDPNKAQ